MPRMYHQRCWSSFFFCDAWQRRLFTQGDGSRAGSAAGRGPGLQLERHHPPGAAHAATAVIESTGVDQLQKYLDMDHAQLAIHALNKDKKIVSLIKERDSARKSLKLEKQTSRRKDAAREKELAKQQQKEERRCQNSDWLPITKISQDQYFSWITIHGLLAIGIRRNLSCASARGFGLAAGCAVSRQVVGALLGSVCTSSCLDTPEPPFTSLGDRPILL